MSEEIKLKSTRISLIVTIIIAAFLCTGFVSALNSDEASVHVFFTPTTLQAGQTVTVNIFFTSNSSDALQITSIGLHFDWMATDNFVGINDLSSAPITIAAGDTSGLPQISIQIPSNVTSGVHNYFVTIDGTQGASSTAFTWDSPTLSVAVTGGSGQTVAPTQPTGPTSTNSGGEPEGQNNLLLYGAIGAVVVIVVLMVLVLVVRKKRTQPKPAANQGATQPETPSPPPKSNPEQDFDI
jgi:hypothetical protein